MKGKALKPGDTIGLITPATGIFEPGRVDVAIEALGKHGFHVALGKHLFKRDGYLAGSDEERAEDFNEMWKNPEIDGIICFQGGGGSSRILPAIDYQAIVEHPKIFVGLSDITALLLAIYKMTGLVTFHGPSALSAQNSEYTESFFLKALTSPEPIGEITDPPLEKPYDPPYPPPRLVIAEGKARGPIVGGNLTLVKELMGTPYEIDTRGKIFFFEDINEEPHSIDRMLTQLLLAGKIQEAAGIVIGECVGCTPRTMGKKGIPFNFSTEEVFYERLGDLGIPVIYGIRLGHGKDRVTIPLGVMATLEARGREAKLVIEEEGTV
ncbi:MAG: LD-carboxypeptidase [Candidatus Tectomicrobia bacterium]|nr:LD-carboxypeptidase [Candidatus Tectomicrobia bacterium]